MLFNQPRICTICEPHDPRNVYIYPEEIINILQTECKDLKMMLNMRYIGL